LTFTHHGIKLSFPNSKTAPATLVTGGADGEVKTYNLLQMHYHFKSEHLATDKQHSAEAHFVFSDGTNEGDFLAVLGVFLRKGNNKKA